MSEQLLFVNPFSNSTNARIEFELFIQYIVLLLNKSNIFLIAVFDYTIILLKSSDIKLLQLKNK